jgi:hypothetical protein
MSVLCALKTVYLFHGFVQQDMFATSREQKELNSHVLRASFVRLEQHRLTHFVDMTDSTKCH